MEPNEYDILLEIFRFIRDYDTGTYALPEVCVRLHTYLVSAGHDVTLTNIDRNSKRVEVDGHGYKVLRRNGWSHYDVIRTA